MKSVQVVRSWNHLSLDGLGTMWSEQLNYHKMSTLCANQDTCCGPKGQGSRVRVHQAEMADLEVCLPLFLLAGGADVLLHLLHRLVSLQETRSQNLQRRAELT